MEKVSLLSALDPNLGIGYANLHEIRGGDIFLNGLDFPIESKAASSIEWTSIHMFFLKSWLQKNDEFSPIRISEADVKKLDHGGIAEIPPSFSVLFTKKIGDKIIIDSAGGATGTSLIGRFSIFSNQVNELCREIAKTETENNPDVVFADIHQLSNEHVDNINRRNRIYDYIIPISTIFQTNENDILKLDDIVVSVRADEIILESISLKKRIIPRLATAYNYHNNNTPIFRFLCDLQYQKIASDLTFDLEKLFPGMNYYPRVEYKDIIFCLAKWYLRKEEIEGILAAPNSSWYFKEFRSKRGIPKYVLLGRTDQQLVFNLEDDNELFFFIESLKDGHNAVIREYLFPDGAVRDNNDKTFSAQYLAFAERGDPVYKKVVSVDANASKTIIRDFSPGSEWLYFKLYTTQQSANNVLSNIIYPIVRQFKKLIFRWFFIRYQDPHPHLRIRIKIAKKDLTILLSAFEKIISLKRHKGLVKNMQIDTYRRELERYNPELIDSIEDLFYYSSEVALKHLFNRRFDSETKELFPLRLIYCMIKMFYENVDDQIAFLEWRKGDFVKEFKVEPKLKREFDQKYREIFAKISLLNEPVLSLEELKNIKPLCNALKTIDIKSRNWADINKAILYADILHMQINRSFASDQRQHEAVIFYLLHKFLLSKKARLRNYKE